MLGTCSWKGYDFTILSPSTTWNPVSGLYIFAGPSQNPPDLTRQWWTAYYIGQTISFANRVPDHDRWEEAVALGATHIHAMTMLIPFLDTAEHNLIAAFQPPLNTHHR